MLFAFPVLAGQGDHKDASLRIRVKIIQCGRMDGILEACEEQAACCHFVDPADLARLESKPRDFEEIEIAENQCGANSDDPRCSFTQE